MRQGAALGNESKPRSRAAGGNGTIRAVGRNGRENCRAHRRKDLKQEAGQTVQILPRGPIKSHLQWLCWSPGGLARAAGREVEGRLGTVGDM